MPTCGRRGKIVTQGFDVFLCYDSIDTPVIKRIAEQLRERGILPWLDEWEQRPGLSWKRLLEMQIKQIKSAAVFVGKSGIGPWQQLELYAFLREFVKRGCPVVPVLLEYAPEKPELPLFLEDRIWVDFRVQEPDPLQRLLWGITGKRDIDTKLRSKMQCGPDADARSATTARRVEIAHANVTWYE